MAIAPQARRRMTGAQVQDAIDAARPNHVIDLPPCRIAGSFVVNKPVTLRGAGAAKTILEGDGSGPVLSIEAEAGSTRVDELSITRGRSSFGAGVAISNGARVEIRRCLITQNRASAGCGGAIAVDAGELLLAESTLAWNTAQLGGGLYVGGEARAQLLGVVLEGNSAARGGGLAARDAGEVEVWTCRFQQNRADDEGHHLWAVASWHQRPFVAVSNSIFGPYADELGVPIATDALFPAQIGLFQTAVAKEVQASVFEG